MAAIMLSPFCSSSLLLVHETKLTIRVEVKVKGLGLGLRVEQGQGK
jgi:hypothetical protein